jgi:hypothetical protein
MAQKAYGQTLSGLFCASQLCEIAARERKKTSMNSLAETMIFIGGVFNLGFAIFHLMFWRLFRWKDELALLTIINRSVMQILNLCLILVFIVMAYISFFNTTELISTNLGRALLVAFSLFWFLRMIEQVIFFGIKKTVSGAFALVFLFLSVIYIVPVLQGKS